MSKTLEEMAEEWVKLKAANLDIDCDLYNKADDKSVCSDCRHIYWGAVRGFLAGYKAAQAIVEEELQAVQAQRAEFPGLGAAQYALKSVLAKMGSK